MLSWTTDSTHNVTITTIGSAKCGIARLTGYRLVISQDWGYGLKVASYTKVYGIGIKNTSNYRYGGFYSEGFNVVFDSCIAYDMPTSSAGGNYPFGFAEANTNGSYSAIFVNCIAYNCKVGIMFANSGIKYAYNCVVLNSGLYGIQNQDWGYAYFKNCYAGASGTVDYSDPVSRATLTTCRSSDGSHSTTVVACSVSSGAYFTNVTSGSEDCTIKTGSSFIDAGTDLHADGVYPFNYDFTGDTRPDSYWDIGADEYVGATLFGGGNLFIGGGACY
jgi:hypothetical protein